MSKKQLDHTDDEHKEELTVPLLLVCPLTESMEWTLPYLLAQDSPFRVQIVQLTDFILQEADFIKPCICLFSVNDGNKRDELKKIFKGRQKLLKAEGKSKLDPLLRIVIISEEKQGLVLDSWQELGAQEVIIAPILSKPLVSKLYRHMEKIRLTLKHMEDEDREKLEEKRNTKDESKEEPSPQKQFVVHGVVLGPNTFLFPKDDSIECEKVVVSVEVDAKDFSTEDGYWVPKNVDPKTGEGEWDWVISNIGMLDENKRKKASKMRMTYQGFKPLYDFENQKWHFAGSNPALYAFKESYEEKKDETSVKTQIKNNISTPENIAFMNTKANGIAFFKRTLSPKNMKVMYFTKDQWKDVEKNFFEKGKNKNKKKSDSNQSPDSKSWNNKLTEDPVAKNWNNKLAKKEETSSKRQSDEAEIDLDKALLSALNIAVTGKVKK